VLNRCDAGSALARAENLRTAIDQKRIAARRKSVAVTISVGLALSTDFTGEEVDEIVQEADYALYAAKRPGRNCVRVVRNGEGIAKAESNKTETGILAK
jgi:diguanylate cyclase (GGDEF)-like protein